MVDILIFDQLNRNLWTFAITLLFVCTLIFFNRGRKSKTPKERFYFSGFFAVYVGLTLQRFFFFISDYFTTGFYVGDTYYGFYDVLDPIYTTLVSIGYLAFFITMTFSFLMFESVMKESKYFFSLISLIALITFLYMPMSYKVTLRYFLTFIDGALLFVILIRFLKYSDKKFQKISKAMLISLAFYVFGSLADIGLIKELTGSPSFPIFFFIASAFIGLYTLILNLEEENK